MNYDKFKNPAFLEYPTATVCKMFWGRVAKNEKKLSVYEQTETDWKKWTWKEVGDEVEKLALGLHSLGVAPRDPVAIFLPTSVQWEMLDYALASLGAISVSIYDRATPQQAAKLICHSESKVLITINSKLLQEVVQSGTPSLKSGIILKGMILKSPSELKTIRYSDLFEMGNIESDFFGKKYFSFST